MINLITKTLLSAVIIASTATTAFAGGLDGIKFNGPVDGLVLETSKTVLLQDTALKSVGIASEDLKNISVSVNSAPAGNVIIPANVLENTLPATKINVSNMDVENSISQNHPISPNDQLYVGNPTDFIPAQGGVVISSSMISQPSVEKFKKVIENTTNPDPVAPSSGNGNTGSGKKVYGSMGTVTQKKVTVSPTTYQESESVVITDATPLTTYRHIPVLSEEELARQKTIIDNDNNNDSRLGASVMNTNSSVSLIGLLIIILVIVAVVGVAREYTIRARTAKKMQSMNHTHSVA